MTMSKTVLITGSTDGIGLETAKTLVAKGHYVLLHGRSPAKLEAAQRLLSATSAGGRVESYVADFSRMSDVETLAKAVADKHAQLDVLINNAGVFNAPEPVSQDGLEIRFAVNTLAPYLLTQRLLPLLGNSGRIINLSSAAQSAVNLKAISGQVSLSEGEAYAQSKLALTMWSRSLALLHAGGPAIIAVNPGSLLASKMVKEAFGIPGKDLQLGADILTRAALEDEFKTASGQYFDNDSGQFASPHPDAMNESKTADLVREIESVLARVTSTT